MRVVLFVVLTTGRALDDGLPERSSCRSERREPAPRAGADHRQVPDIPRTKSGKITEIAVRDIVHGREVKNQEALANPQALDYYRDLEELRK